MRVVFLFMTTGGTNDIPTWNPKATAQNKYLDNGGLESEGLYWMLKEMKAKGFIKDMLLIIESSRGCGRFKLNGNLGFVVPHISEVDKVLRKGDVLFVRGGFRGWHDWLASKKGKHWLVLYAANTGRQRWPWWDAILDDLDLELRIDTENRLWFPFSKPVHEEIFRFIPESNPIYDFCIGASFIHDRKGQWRTIRALEEYKKIYGKIPKCIMPGAVRHSTQTNKILGLAKDLGVDMPGMVPRSDLNVILNSSKVFVHLGTSGQNDRGPIEALRCGCQLIIGTPAYHSPYITYGKYCTVPKNKDDFGSVARLFRDILKHYSPKDRNKATSWYNKTSGSDYLIPTMGRLFSSFGESAPSLDFIKERYSNEAFGGYL